MMNKERLIRGIRCQLTLILFALLLLHSPFMNAQPTSDELITVVKYPKNGATGVNPDVQLRLCFPSEPVLGNSGMIRIYDSSNDKLVDSLDMSIPPGPKNTRTPAPYDNIVYESEQIYANDKKTEKERKFIPTPLDDIYQHNYIGGSGEADVYHFYPVLIHDSVATICLHNNHLEYNKTYYVLIDPKVFTINDAGFSGIEEKSDWTFTTKKAPPRDNMDWFVVSPDGSGDFNTVQGAIDFIPENNPDRKTIYIKNGTYEEIVYFRNKMNLTILGENRDKVTVCYANNGFFNPRPTGPREEMIKRFRNRRAVFSVHNSKGIHLVNFSVKSIGVKPAQAEGLLIIGEENIVSNVTIVGSGDALQATGTIYITDSCLEGFGDNVLGYGAVFFNRCELTSTYGPHLWVRNSSANHGNVFLNCMFSTIGDVETVIARAPTSRGISYPYCEAVLINCTLEGISPVGWGPVGEESSNIHYWEYNSREKDDDKPVNVSQRHPVSRQLTMEDDSLTISNYSNPTFVLGGWTPKMSPLVLSQPQAKKVKNGQSVDFCVNVAAIPEVSYQWFLNSEAIAGATDPVLKIESASANNEGDYRVTIKNHSGTVSSHKAQLMVK